MLLRRRNRLNLWRLWRFCSVGLVPAFGRGGRDRNWKFFDKEVLHLQRDFLQLGTIEILSFRHGETQSKRGLFQWQFDCLFGRKVRESVAGKLAACFGGKPIAQ